MKTRKLPVPTLVFGSFSEGWSSDFFEKFAPLEGKERIKNKTYKLAFDEIHISQSIVTEVVKSETEKVIVRAPGDLQEFISVENTLGKLHIRFKNAVNISTKKISVKIFAKNLNKITVTSSAEVLVRDKILQDKIEIDVKSSGQIHADLEAEDVAIEVVSSGNFSGSISAKNLKANVFSSGRIYALGMAKTAEIQAKSSGKFSGTEMLVETANLEAASTGWIDLSVSSKLSADASYHGKIFVKKIGKMKVIKKEETEGGVVDVI
ncbi:MAG: DUF2807 domain-containing protein [Flavobacteriaceae bacterium]|jgi:hypothetical protein|nr:DUF2807 domain-containing protein [Flavobacteriaceae bacterium]